MRWSGTTALLSYEQTSENSHQWVAVDGSGLFLFSEETGDKLGQGWPARRGQAALGQQNPVGGFYNLSIPIRNGQIE
jgi:hypothetical protein